MTATHAAGVTPRTTRTHAPGALTQTTGLTVLALAPATLFAVGAATGADLGEGVVFIVIGAVIAVGAVLAARFGTWSKVVGIVLTLLAALAGFWLTFGLLAPQSPADFVAGAMFVLGTVLSLAGGIQAIRRRATLVDRPTRGEARSRWTSIAVVGVALVASLAVNLLGRTTVPAAEAEGASPVAIGSFAFTSDTVTVTAGEPARVVVSNGDAFMHDFAIPDHDVGPVSVAPGSQALVDLSDLAAGTYTYYCTLHSDTSVADPEDAGMAGTLIVE